MTSREVTRLKRLKLDKLEAPRLREEIAKAIAAFETEATAAAAERARLEGIARRLTAEVAIAPAPDVRVPLPPRGPFDEPAPGEGSDLPPPERPLADVPAADLPRLDRIEAEVGTLKALRVETAELRALVEALRAREETPPPRDLPVIDTSAIFASVADALSEAQGKLPEGFALGSVEAEVKGAMGAEGGRVVMGLDARVANGAVSTLKFSLVPQPRTVLLD